MRYASLLDACQVTGADAIGVRVGKVVNRYKVAKNFELIIDEAAFAFSRQQEAINAEAALDKPCYQGREIQPALQLN